VRSYEERARQARVRAAHFLVEIHKKYVIASACLVFVLVGVPIAIRFPRGGMGLVIGVSLSIFAVYYIGLIAGESLADRLAAPPWILWVPNALFTVAGLTMLYLSHRSGVSRRRLRPARETP
jgi:lipopolysaccharide export system permease protein